MLHVLALTLGAGRMPLAMLRKWLDSIKHVVALAATIFVGRHAALQIQPSAEQALVLTSVGRD